MVVEGHRKSAEFDVAIDESATIAIPEHIVKELGRSPGRIHVRLTRGVINSELRDRHVNEEEIERISDMQLESRDQVVKFLLSESALKKSAMRRKMQR